ncbi:DUF192 domain-containing protein [Rosettibacter firmus]|uniref:DUF192 domain-containing protein n=1 Tax=Rosettibacter firmus TaxID=3111522 RepID=UPI00336BEF2E
MVKKKKRKNLIMQVTVGVVILLFIVYFVLSNVIMNKEEINPELEKAMKGKAAYSFTKEGELTFIKPDGELISQLNIEIADDDEQRMTGLMFRDKMEENQGMLFIFPYEAQQSFWMKNTFIPLDMIFVNSKMEIVKIHKNTTPFSEQSYSSGQPAQYVVEVNAGYTDKYGIKEGDKIVWRRD